MTPHRFLAVTVLAVPCVALTGCSTTPSNSPESAPTWSVEDHLALFDPPPMHPVSASRAADGRPGPGYWQQQTDYVIAAELDPAKRRVSATATLTYTNNSPMDLAYMWFELPVDALRDTSRSSAIRHINTRFRASGPDMGFRGLEFSINGETIEHLRTDTRALVKLPSPVAASGGQIEIEIAWRFKVPEKSNRLGVLEFEGDELYEIARWIPQPCVYDDIYGWNTLPYLGAGESYSDFGNYDVTISAPVGVTLAGGGEWVNPSERLTADQFERYERAFESDEPVWIITPEEAAAWEDEPTDEGVDSNEETQGREHPIEDAAEEDSEAEGDAPEEDVAEDDAVEDDTAEDDAAEESEDPDDAADPELLEWHYTASNVRTFAFVAGRSYAMDGAGVDIGGEGGQRVRCLSVFPPKVSELWHGTSTPAIRHALSFYSEFLGLDYPYPVMVNCFGVEGGTEYPMMVFCGSRPPTKPDTDGLSDEEAEAADEEYTERFERTQRGLFGVTDHEVLHSWFPMIVGNDERRDGWMDEGFDEYGNPYSLVAWEEANADEDEEMEESDGLRGQSGTAEFDAGDALSVVRYISAYAFRRPVPPILTWADRSQAHGARGLNVYSKPAAGLITLREGILGADRFDHALATYLNAWAFKHPRPGDFFRCIENAAGEDLGWFWRGWFGSTDTLDLAVRAVELVEPSRGEAYWAITVEMVGAIPAPATLRIEFDTGEQIVREVPVEAFYGGREFTLRVYDPDRTPFSVLLDPERVLPDADRGNNRWVNGG